MKYFLVLMILTLPLLASDPAVVETKDLTPVTGPELSEHRKATAEVASLLARINALKIQILTAQTAQRVLAELEPDFEAMQKSYGERIKTLQQSHGAGNAELTLDGQWITRPQAQTDL